METNVKRFCLSEQGGPEVMQWSGQTLDEPGAGEVLLRQTAIGLNYIDTYHRSGLYPLELPSGLGVEAAGVVEAVGPECGDLAIGDRVGYCQGPIGAYAEARIMPADNLIPLPDGIDDTTAAAVLLKGLTAAFLLRKTFPVQAGQQVLVHAAAGGVGLLLVQWAKHLGARVIGSVGSPAKAELATQQGCDDVILYRQQAVAERVRALTEGRGVEVVYDSVGKDTFAASLDSLATRGMLVSYGNASGPAPEVKPLTLAQKGSLFLTRPTLWHYIERPAERLALTRELFALLEAGVLTVNINHTYALAEAPRAHRDLEARKTSGSVVLLP
ncbi:quinone oxidoreductase [Exilibacterium tricleocarpae]|uniref:NADPH:quinone reductase n=1 Tax=Exilibacterium tricleocarpae TaxID=2591008 RepID=A0A545T8H5_9GAMM|nr:quinone oxidoreductase [Exilibacterium tricleocarpae]TQV73516.1 quinone oxidoreductase [Exilibacterium tricleocarpae]